MNDRIDDIETCSSDELRVEWRHTYLVRCAAIGQLNILQKAPSGMNTYLATEVAMSRATAAEISNSLRLRLEQIENEMRRRDEWDEETPIILMLDSFNDE